MLEPQIKVQLYMYIVFLVTGLISAVIARKKGRSFVGWFCVGFLLSLIGVFIAWKISPASGIAKAR